MARPERIAELRDVSFRFGARPALEEISLSLPRGAVVALIGPNGAGKTTLLRLLLGVLRPSAGEVVVHGRAAYMPQLGPAAWTFPVTAQGVALQGAYRRVGWLRRPRAAERRRALDALAAVGVEGLAGRQVGALSAGQRQRVLLARALVQEGELLLLDEPLSGADAATERLFADALARVRDAGGTAVVSTHDLGWASRFADLVCLLAGRVHGFGPPALALTPQTLAAAYGGALLEVGGVRLLAPEAPVA